MTNIGITVIHGTVTDASNQRNTFPGAVPGAGPNPPGDAVPGVGGGIGGGGEGEAAAVGGLGGGFGLTGATGRFFGGAAAGTGVSSATTGSGSITVMPATVPASAVSQLFWASWMRTGTV